MLFLVERGGGIEAGHVQLVELSLKIGDGLSLLIDLVVHEADLVGNALKENIHFVDVVTLTIDGETLLLDVLCGNGHVQILPNRQPIGDCSLEKAKNKRYSEL